MRSELAAAIARTEGADKVLEQTNLAHWHDATTSFAFDAAADRPRSYWTAQDGVIAHLAGSGADFLLYDYPLTGTYQWSVQVYQGPWSESAITHGGLVIEPFTGQGNASISVPGLYQALTIPWNLVRQDGFNTVTVDVNPKAVRYLVNNHLFYTDEKPGTASPWIGLFTHRDRHSIWRKPQLSGEPVIPREISLCKEGRLDGWISGFYNETSPMRIAQQTQDRYGNAINVPRAKATATAKTPAEPVDVNLFDWAAADGVIHGRRALA